MALTGDDLKDFIEAYENAFGERLTVEQANELFFRLLHLYRLIRRTNAGTIAEGPVADRGGDEEPTREGGRTESSP